MSPEASIVRVLAALSKSFIGASALALGDRSREARKFAEKLR
ncbi:MAG TPA: hypothetical protein VMV10_25145 [Pirellulales bacterium]|nr:hypothetical protein [Pirellulales bacterium]